MRDVTTIFFAAIVTLAAAAAPALAKTSDLAKTGGELSPPPCHAYEQNPDGSWKELPCQEDGLKPQAGAKVSTRNEGNATRRN